MKVNDLVSELTREFTAARDGAPSNAYIRGYYKHNVPTYYGWAVSSLKYVGGLIKTEYPELLDKELVDLPKTAEARSLAYPKLAEDKHMADSNKNIGRAVNLMKGKYDVELVDEPLIPKDPPVQQAAKKTAESTTSKVVEKKKKSLADRLLGCLFKEEDDDESTSKKNKQVKRCQDQHCEEGRRKSTTGQEDKLAKEIEDLREQVKILTKENEALRQNGYSRKPNPDTKPEFIDVVDLDVK